MINKYQSEAAKLKVFYDEEMPKLCATRSFMSSNASNSRVETLTSLFNFPFNDQTRKFADPSLSCMNFSDTEQSLAYSGLFDYTPPDYQFQNENETVTEEAGYIETNITRTATGKERWGLHL